LTADPELWWRTHRAARAEGIAPALAVLRPGASAGGYAVVPASDPRAGTVMRAAELPGGAVRVLSGCSDPAPPLDAAVWLRLGVSEGLLDACLTYLESRRSGDSTLLRQQLIQGAIAEAFTEQLEVRAELVAAGTELTPELLAYLHAKISEVDRALLRLLGASGFLASGPGEVADISALVACVYCPAPRGSS
jgi:hypothetical protein